ncbi:MAG TPA: succinate dehydrogenase, hydrophobic membrane anchor protein [Gammaproteobacteria bacterium]|jgi:succinate dehydrogenase / fumarate reductase membrane anchor subunit|nr:succinate dehydrogenase, hydrophobic membrane anchor protein [Gammaproteobacteria bacterium]
MNYRAPLRTVRHYGAAEHGTGHWIAQRVSAVALIPLTLWFTAALLYTVFTANYTGAIAWIGRPWNTLALVLLVGAVFYHSQLGWQVIVEDYVQGFWAKTAIIMAIKLVSLLVAAAAILAVLRVAFGG